jgi:dTDP-4-dehydrorhamnose reductase
VSETRTLVVGASGLMGAHLLEAFGALGEVAGTALSQSGDRLEHLDLADAVATRAAVERHAPAIVVCAAAISNVETCELEPVETRAVNVAGTSVLAEAARAAGATFIFLSSEYVFDGDDGPYDEDGPVSPINEYGRQKVAVEAALAEHGADWIVARVSCVYGREARRKNFVYQLFDSLSAGRELRAPSDQVGTPTEAANAAAVIRELWSAGERGTFHVAGADRVIRSDFGAIVAEELGLDPTLVRPTPTEELGLAASRPRGAGLLNGRAAARVSTRLLGVREGIQSVLATAPLGPASGS